MPNSPNKQKQASQALMSLARLWGRLEKRIRNYGTDFPLPASEIHIIKAIREIDDIHVSGLAEFFGVTKGAVSQTLAKLEKKGLVAKEPHQDNLSRLKLKLSPKGQQAYARHEQIHATFDRLVAKNLALRPTDFSANLIAFLRNLEAELSQFEE